jgi:O-antigen biosynthesis protein WbqP
MKRLFDLAAGLSAAMLIALPIVLVGLAVRLTSPGPTLF